MEVTTRRVYVAIDVNASRYVSDWDLHTGITEVLVKALDKNGEPLVSKYMRAMHTNDVAEMYYVHLEVLPEPKSIRVIEV